jgi:hypothetical protein
MSEAFVLDLLFFAILALVSMVGLVRGPGRMLMLAAGILLGAEIGLWWGDDWGARIADLIDIRVETGVFVCSMIALLVTAFVSGHLSGSVFGVDAPSSVAKLTGLALGAVNGTLMIAMALRFFYVSYENRLVSDPLDDTVAARILWRQFDWYLLTIAGVIAATELMVHVIWGRIPFTEGLQTTVSPRGDWSAPARANVQAPGTGGIPSDRSRRLPQPLSGNGLSWDESFVTKSVPISGTAQEIRLEDSPIGPSSIGPESTGQSPDAESLTLGGVERQRPGSASVASDSAARRIKFCRNCGMALNESDRFCPDCGFHL